MKKSNYAIITKQSRVVISKVDIDLATEVGAWSQSNSSKLLVWEMSLFMYEAMVLYVNGVEWLQQGLTDTCTYTHGHCLIPRPSQLPVMGDKNH